MVYFILYYYTAARLRRTAFGQNTAFSPQTEEKQLLLRAILRGDLRTAFITLALSLPAIVLCLSVHEAAHGAAAYLLGDRTARNAGRVTLSPLAHIDPMGFVCLLLFGFGWARPVPVNISNFKNRRWGMALTALAGPLSNFVTAFIAYCLYLLVWMNSSSVFMQTLGMFLSSSRSIRSTARASWMHFCRSRGRSASRDTRISSFWCSSRRCGSAGSTAL